MLTKMIKNFAIGVLLGCFVSNINIVVLMYFGVPVLEDITAGGYLMFLIGGSVIGLGYSLPSIVYESKRLPLAAKVVIQLGVGTLVFCAVALWLGWMPSPIGENGAAIFGLYIIIAIAVAAAIWFVFWLWYRREAKLINARLAELQKE